MGISVQFHAMPSEILGLFSDLFLDGQIVAVEAVGSPTKFSALDQRTVPDFDEERKVVAFTLGEPDLSASSVYEFVERNKDALILELGQALPSGVTESCLSANTDNPAALTRWRRAAKNLHAATLSGTIALNPKSGVESLIKWHRFTEAARHAFLNGTVMLPVAGNNILQFR